MTAVARRIGSMAAALFLLGFSSMFACYVVRAALPYLALDIGASADWVTRVLYVGFVVLTILNPLSGHVCDRLGRLRVALASTVLSSLAIACYALVTDVEGLLLVRIAHAVVFEVLLAVSLGLVAEVSSRSGLGFSTLRFGQGIGIAIGITCGDLITSLAGPRIAMVLAAVAVTTPIPLYLSVKARIR